MQNFTFGDAFKGEEHSAFKWRGGKYGALLIHGFPGTPMEMQSVARTLHEAGWTVHAPLLPGFGAEIDRLAEVGVEDWLACVREGLVALRQECERVVVVGLSMGGALSVVVSADIAPDGLVLLAPFWKLEHMLWRALPVLRYVIPQFKPFKLFKPDFSDAETRAGIRKFMPDVDLDDVKVREGILNFSVPTGIVDQVRQVGEMAHRQAGRVNVPTLIVQGTADELVLPAITRQFMGRLGHGVRYVEVDGAHDLTNDMGKHWVDVEKALLDFVRRGGAITS